MSETTQPRDDVCGRHRRVKCIHLVPCTGYESEDRDFPCMATGETDVDGAVMPVQCELWLDHEGTHWDGEVFTFWGRP